jgi:hypothetical protein
VSDSLARHAARLEQDCAAQPIPVNRRGVGCRPPDRAGATRPGLWVPPPSPPATSATNGAFLEEEWPPGKGSAAEVQRESQRRNRSYPRTAAIGVPVRPRRMGPTSSGPGPPASKRPEAKQVSWASGRVLLTLIACRGKRHGGEVRGLGGLGVEARLRARQAILSPAPAILRVASP